MTLLLNKHEKSMSLKELETDYWNVSVYGFLNQIEEPGGRKNGTSYKL